MANPFFSSLARSKYLSMVSSPYIFTLWSAGIEIHRFLFFVLLPGPRICLWFPLLLILLCCLLELQNSLDGKSLLYLFDCLFEFMAY